MSDISETLREQEGHHEVAEEKDGEEEARGVLEAHSRSTPLRTSARAANATTVTITNSRSAMQELQSSGGPLDHVSSLALGPGAAAVANGPLTRGHQILTPR